jgi:hypothetical protein
MSFLYSSSSSVTATLGGAVGDWAAKRGGCDWDEVEGWGGILPSREDLDRFAQPQAEQTDPNPPDSARSPPILPPRPNHNHLSSPPSTASIWYKGERWAIGRRREVVVIGTRWKDGGGSCRVWRSRIYVVSLLLLLLRHRYLGVSPQPQAEQTDPNPLLSLRLRADTKVAVTEEEEE